MAQPPGTAGGLQSVRDMLAEKVGFMPKDPVGWLYVARGLYKLREYNQVIEAASYCLRNEKTQREAQHLLAFSLLNSGQSEAAANAFLKSVSMGNESDWQPLVELALDNPRMVFKKVK
eukprot:tig00021571_g22363.t1